MCVEVFVHHMFGRSHLVSFVSKECVSMCSFIVVHGDRYTP